MIVSRSSCRTYRCGLLQVVEDITPRGLPATYNSEPWPGIFFQELLLELLGGCGLEDSVITSRFGRQLSGKSVVDDEAYEAGMSKIFKAFWES